MVILNRFKEYPPLEHYFIGIHSPNILQKLTKLDYNDQYSFMVI